MGYGMEFAVHTSVYMDKRNSLAEGEKAFGFGLLPSTFTSSFKMVSVSWIMSPYYISNIWYSRSFWWHSIHRKHSTELKIFCHYNFKSQLKYTCFSSGKFKLNCCSEHFPGNSGDVSTHNVPLILGHTPYTTNRSVYRRRVDTYLVLVLCTSEFVF